MSALNLFIRCTHTGLYIDGRVNTASVFIPDLDVGYENQLKKTPCYVPAGGHIDIPATARSFLSFETGAIKKFSDAGVISSRFFLKPETCANSTRLAASLYPVGASVWNSDDAALNWSDGAGNWRDGAGNIT